MNPDRRDRNRRTIRLRTYDYTWAGAYFVTIVIQDRARLLGNLIGDQVRLGHAGRMVLDAWLRLPERFGTIRLDAFVVMPNHVHGIVVLTDSATSSVVPGRAPVGAGLVPALHRPDPSQTSESGVIDRVADRVHTAESRATTRVAPTVARPRVGDIVGAFKSTTTLAYTVGVHRDGWPEFRRRLWQRNYYERIIRDEEELWRIRGYIRDNPARWAQRAV